jgi:methionine synthase / methylenetetrahydrofolate reductase(NADPH)
LTAVILGAGLRAAAVKHNRDMLKPVLEYLEDNIIVADGAMGTQLYAKGVFLNRCFDELNLSNPSLVREVHQEYLWAGSELLETNTFGANRLKLEPHGLADRVAAINAAGVRLAREVARDSAYIAGSVGPLGTRVEPLGRLSLVEARRVFVEQVGALVEAGVDLISLETFSDLHELNAAIQAVRDVANLPIMAQVTLQDDANSLDGTPPETFAPLIESWGADIVGTNCGVGPQAMLECVERMAPSGNRRLTARPNAGKPRSLEGRNIYLSSPEYFASYARRFVRAGVRVIGGCCGTTPAHIKAMKEAVAAQAVPRRKIVVTVPGGPRVSVERVPVAPRSRLAQRLAEGRSVNAIDIVPPPGVGGEAILPRARLATRSGVDAICISDAPRGVAAMSAVALAAMLEMNNAGETILRLSCRERALTALQSELLGTYALGIRNVLLSTGEPLRVGDFIDATAVVDADVVGVAHLLTRLGEGQDLGGKDIGTPASFHVGVSVDPTAPDLDAEIERLDKKISAGAHFLVTEPVYEPDLLEKFLLRAGPPRLPLIATVRAVLNYREAELLRNEITGIGIPDSLVERLREAGSPEAERLEGLRAARETARALRPMTRGLMVICRSPDPEDALGIFSEPQA